VTVRSGDIENLYTEILSKCDKEQIDFTTFVELNNQFPELMDFFDIFNYGSSKTSNYNIKRERLNELEEMNRKLTLLIQKCGICKKIIYIDCETNKKITLCPKSMIFPPPR
jgi:hypothetical protein